MSAVLQIGSLLGSILGSSHASAVAAEANNLNQAVPTYKANLIAIVTAFNSGKIDGPTAVQAVDEAVTEYYNAVSGIIKDSSNHGTACTSADASGSGSNCNGPCTVGCAWIVPWAARVKTAIQNGSQTVTFDAIPSHSGFNGLPAWSLTTAHSFQTQLLQPVTSPAVPVQVIAPQPATILQTLSGSNNGTSSVVNNSPVPASANVPATNLNISNSVLPAKKNTLLLVLLGVLGFIAALFVLGSDK